MNSHQIRFDEDLVRRYDRSGPRYTSYPTAVQFSDRFGVNEYRAVAVASNQDPIPRPLSLYVHIPFCSSPCFYCGCTKVITRNHEKAEAYLYRLHREIEMQGDLYDRDRVVEQLHFGGGTPTFLTSLEIERLVEKIGQHFQLSSDAGREYSIELDPRTITTDTLRDLYRIGFNRCSLGIQDFDPAVQEAVNRVQSVPDTLRLIREAREFGFNSVSVDLIYGLPKQSVPGFSKTLDTVLAARPNRFAVYAYAHLPQMFKPQKQIKVEDLATPETRLQLLELTIDKLSAAGYIYIGMDHFALPDDELVLAQESGTMYRNFQGYSTRGYCDLVGLGVSSIGKVGDHYIQNLKTLPEYYGAIDRGELPVHRGYTMTRDDVIRRDVIQQIMCYGVLDYDATARRHNIDFRQYFASELVALEPMVKDGLAEFAAPGLRVLPSGRLLLRHLAMAFDAYLPSVQASGQRFSKAI
ncbi:MAG: oxygen-independent coproporphyrinogen III oxidase [Proteobacteria bacterium]|nr:oxygen-independent coproporphyrinogen III oxidase [Pseudomonadota bacterium]